MEGYRNPDGTLRDHRDIEATWRDAGITSEKRVGFYCGTGWRACEAYWAARLMGWDHAVVYDGGWYEWSADPTNPTASGDPANPTVHEEPIPWWKRPTVIVPAAAGVLLAVGLIWRGRRARPVDSGRVES